MILPSLNQNYKKILLLFILFLNFIFLVFFFKFQFSFLWKFSLFLFFFLSFLSLLTIFEITNSLISNLAFWLILSSLLSYFFLPGGIILFILSFYKTFSQEKFKQNFLSSPFSFLVKKNYNFLLLTAFLILNLFFYQNFMSKENLPFSFENYQIFLVNFQKALSFFNFQLPLDEKIPDLVSSFLEKKNLPPNLTPFLKSNLTQTTLKEALYQSLEKNWPNKKWRQAFLLTFLLMVTFIFYPLLKLLSPLVSLLSFIFYYFYLKIRLIKITRRSVEKEIIEL